MDFSERYANGGVFQPSSLSRGRISCCFADNIIVYYYPGKK